MGEEEATRTLREQNAELKAMLRSAHAKIESMRQDVGEMFDEPEPWQNYAYEDEDCEDEDCEDEDCEDEDCEDEDCEDEDEKSGELVSRIQSFLSDVGHNSTAAELLSELMEVYDTCPEQTLQEIVEARETTSLEDWWEDHKLWKKLRERLGP